MRSYKYKTKRYRTAKQHKYEYKKERYISKLPEPELEFTDESYEKIDDAAVDRISKTIDTSSRDYQTIRRNLIKKYPKWSQTQRTKFTLGIINRRIELETPKGMKEAVIESRTTLTGRGFGAKRQTMITEKSGKYLGRPQNIKTYIRNGNVWAKNKLTGKSARLS